MEDGTTKVHMEDKNSMDGRSERMRKGSNVMNERGHEGRKAGRSGVWGGSRGEGYRGE